jgi:hypothetical protein
MLHEFELQLVGPSIITPSRSADGSVYCLLMRSSTGELKGGFSFNVGSGFSDLWTTKVKKQILVSPFKVMAPILKDFHVNEKSTTLTILVSMILPKLIL